MLEIRSYTEADRERWDDYVLRSPVAHFGQLTAWRDATERAYGCRAHYWLAVEGGRARGVLPLFERPGRTLFSAPGGLIADDASVAASLLAPAQERVRNQHLDYLELRDQRTAWPELVTNSEHCTMVLELARDPETQWQGFDAKLRNQIRKGEKAGFEVRWGRDQVADFHRVMLESMRDLGTPIRGAGYYRLVLERLGEAADLLVIRRTGEPAGAMLTVGLGETWSDPWASSLRRFFADCPNQVLYWHALQAAIARGMKRFDMGRSQWESGTFRFKQQWGARPVPLHYQYVLGRAQAVPTLEAQKERYALAVKLWQRLPLWAAAALGEPLKRRFPEVL
ncbi:MAG TPA: GNAT family N-acetyltransferase [Candidatus Limnocylindria bacterium]|nr:GNAT family N-acetyltransferase [Candidatus Limnocylindria bacterium]